MKELFIQLGINDKEVSIFLKMLELGAQPVSVIAKHMGVPRSTMYLYLESLRSKGLVEEFERIGIKYFRAISVDEIENLLMIREGEIKHAMDLLKKSEGELKMLENRLSVTPKVNFYEGREAMIKMYEKVLKEKEFCAFYNPEVAGGFDVMDIYFDKVAKVVKKERIKAREFVVDCPKGAEYLKKYSSILHKIKLLPKGAMFDADTIIGADKIYMVSYGENDCAAVEIHNKSLADAQRVMFNELWERIK